MAKTRRSPRQSYGEIIRIAIETGHNAQGKRLSLRELGRRVGLSYEHVRKIVNKELPSASRDANRRLCRYLGLNEEAMWERALEEKFARRFALAALPDVVPVTIDGKMGSLWPELATDVRAKLYAYARVLHDEHMALQRNRLRVADGAR